MQPAAPAQAAPAPPKRPRVFYGWYIVGVALLAQCMSAGTQAFGSGLFLTPMTEEHPFNNRTMYGATKIAGDPDLVFLDEPTTGLDPSARRDLWGLIRDLKARGKTVVLTTASSPRPRSFRIDSTFRIHCRVWPATSGAAHSPGFAPGTAGV